MSKIDDIVELLKESTAEDNYFELWLHDARGLQTTIKEQSAEIERLRRELEGAAEGFESAYVGCEIDFAAYARYARVALEVDRP
jgi:hypothetical protein